MKKLMLSVIFSFFLLLASVQPTAASSQGMHVLSPSEIKAVSDKFNELRKDTNQPLYVTIPFSLTDLEKLQEWQAGFDIAKEKNIIPLVRLTTRFDPEKNAWVVPTRRETMNLIKALDSLQWPQNERHIIVFNEVNHSKEWGGNINPAEFAAVSSFAADWLQTESENYIVLPAAMDLAAPNGSQTKEALAYWEEVIGAEPEYFNKFDAWNSHSYPNPGFASAPTRTGQNSLRGFEHELVFLKKYSDKNWEVYITETGWDQDTLGLSQLTKYYTYAHQHIWSHSQVKAVTPFVLAGSPGPFSGFSFSDEQGKPTKQWQAYSQGLLTAQKAGQLLSQNTQ